MADAVRVARRNPAAHRDISNHRLATIVKRGRCAYRRALKRAGMPLDRDWVRVLGKYSLDVAETWKAGEWVMSKWTPTPDGWMVETVRSSDLVRRAEALGILPEG